MLTSALLLKLGPGGLLNLSPCNCLNKAMKMNLAVTVSSSLARSKKKTKHKHVFV